MKVTLKELRELIREAVVDHMRLPKGPNSRDDAENRPLEEKETVTEASEQKQTLTFDEVEKQFPEAIQALVESDNDPEGFRDWARRSMKFYLHGSRLYGHDTQHPFTNVWSPKRGEWRQVRDVKR